jgi:hypothetical protein
VEPMAARKISDTEGMAALAAWVDSVAGADDIASAVRYTLQILRTKAPGSSVEVRVPPWGAVQAIAGPTHTRGTPPAVVEMSPEVWLSLALGRSQFEDELRAGGIQASGERSNLSAWLPLIELP